MDALGGGSTCGLWRRRQPFNKPHHLREGDGSWKHNASSESARATNGGVESGYWFLLRQALTVRSLALAGDTIAQLRHYWSMLNNYENKHSLTYFDDPSKDILQTLLSGHDWLRALLMTSYGFLFYGPRSCVWYQTLDHHLPQPTVKNLLLKVLLNQIILGPSIIAVVFAWNNLWQQKLSELLRKYQKDALSTLLFAAMLLKLYWVWKCLGVEVSKHQTWPFLEEFFIFRFKIKVSSVIPMSEY